MKPPLLNLVISDTHCGSDYGLLPEHVIMDDRRVLGHGSNQFLKWMWSRFEDMTQRFNDVRGTDPYILTLGGDLIEGIHHGSKEVVAAKFEEHLAIAKAALRPLVAGACKVVTVRGTECHTHDFERIFCKDMRIDPPGDFKQYHVHGCLVDVRHHMPVTSRVHLESGALSIVMANARANMLRNSHPIPRVFLRGHRHCVGDYCDGESMIAVNGAWQGLTRHGSKVVPDAITRPSAYLLDWRHSPKGDLPAIHRFVYKVPYKIHTLTA